MAPFRPNQQLRARDLNLLDAQAKRQALQGPSASTYNNGSGVVMRNPRRTTSRRSSDSITVTGVVPCKITGGSATAGWTVNVYANGIGAASTSEGTLYLLEIAATATLATGAWVMGFPYVTVITGGSE